MEPVLTEIKDHRFLKELLSETDSMLIEMVRGFVDEFILPIRREMEQSARSDFKLIEDLQRGLIPLGFQGGFLPEEYGGMNLTSVMTASILAEEFGRGDAYVNAAYMYDHPEIYGPRHSKQMLSRESIAKVFCCDIAVEATNKAMELMGSYGYVTDYHVEKYWRDVKIIQLWEGGAQLGRLDVARGIYDYDQFHRNVIYDKLQPRNQGE